MKNILWLCVIALIIGSCADLSTEQEADTDTTVQDDLHKSHEHEHATEHDMHEEHAHETLDSDEELSLNNGKQWIVNEEMKPFVKAGEETLNDYVSNSSTDYIALAQSLKATNDKLIKSCTMKGQSHQELHKWLIPHLDLVSALKEAENADEAQEIIHELIESYEVYHTYFK